MSEPITQEGEAPHVRSRANVEAVMRYYQGPWERGRIAEHWTEYDSLALISALGAAVQSS